MLFYKIFSQNQNLMNRLGAGIQNIDRLQLRKRPLYLTATILKTNTKTDNF